MRRASRPAVRWFAAGLTAAMYLGRYRRKALVIDDELGFTGGLNISDDYAAVADGAPDRAFVYLHVRIAAGRERARVTATGEAMMAVVRSHFAAIFASRAVGITLQIDEGAPVFDAKHSSLHPLFQGR